MIPDLMQAVEISTHGGPEVLKPVSRPVPVAGHGQILIRVAWAGVNRPDLFQRAGSYAPPPGASDLPGLECSGIVAAVGPGVTRWKAGDRVCASGEVLSVNGRALVRRLRIDRAGRALPRWSGCRTSH